jgi:hypothetical protein
MKMHMSALKELKKANSRRFGLGRRKRPRWDPLWAGGKTHNDKSPPNTQETERFQQQTAR